MKDPYTLESLKTPKDGNGVERFMLSLGRLLWCMFGAMVGGGIVGGILYAITGWWAITFIFTFMGFYVVGPYEWWKRGR